MNWLEKLVQDPDLYTTDCEKPLQGIIDAVCAYRAEVKKEKYDENLDTKLQSLVETVHCVRRRVWAHQNHVEGGERHHGQQQYHHHPPFHGGRYHKQHHRGRYNHQHHRGPYQRDSPYWRSSQY